MPQVKADPRMLKIMGKSMYSDSSFIIALREALQNAVDAARKNVTVVVKFAGYEETTFEVTDDGVGMTTDEIEDLFLNLGATGKSGSEQVGNFGIGAAAIMASDSWCVRTGRLELTQKDLGNDDPVRTVKDFQPGTKINWEINDYWTGTYQRKRLLYLFYFSDFSVLGKNVSLKMYDKDRLVWDDPNVRFPPGVPATPIEGLDGILGIKGNIVDRFKVTNLGSSYEFESRDVYRTKGMVQFTAHKTDYRTVNLIFDIVTDKRPGDPDYPLSASRESLRGEVATLVDSFITAANVDAITTAKKLLPEKEEKPTKKYRRGHLLRGYRTKMTSQIQRTGDDLEIASIVDEHGQEVLVDASKISVRPDGDIVVDANGKELVLHSRKADTMYPVTMNPIANVRYNIQGLWETERMVQMQEIVIPEDTGIIELLITGYVPDRHKVKFHTKVLEVWGRLLQITADQHEEFGLGITSKVSTIAERATEGGLTYYVINPDLALADATTPEGMVIRMWQLAAHECAHAYVDVHNELWAGKQDDIISVTSEELLMDLKQLAKMLR